MTTHLAARKVDHYGGEFLPVKPSATPRTRIFARFFSSEVRDMREAVFHKPVKGLADLVEYMWHYEYFAPHHYAERIFPQGNHYLLINLNHTPVYVTDLGWPNNPVAIPEAMIDGAHTRAVILDYGTTLHSMGMVFRPGAIPRLFGYPASDVVNEIVPLDSVLGSIVGSLRAELQDAGSAAERIRLLESLFLRFRDRGSVCDPTILAALRKLDDPLSGTQNISSLSHELGIAHRRLIKLFRDEVGLTPKRYARLARFRTALWRMDTQQETCLTSLAQDLGYCDQAHFIKDFRSLAGLSPGKYSRCFRYHAGWARRIAPKRPIATTADA